MKLISNDDECLSVEMSIDEFKSLMAALSATRQEFSLLDPSIHRLMKDDIERLDDSLLAIWRDHLGNNI